MPSIENHLKLIPSLCGFCTEAKTFSSHSRGINLQRLSKVCLNTPQKVVESMVRTSWKTFLDHFSAFLKENIYKKH